MMRDQQNDVLRFWFEECEPAQWFLKDDDFDRTIRDRFLPILMKAQDGLCDHWMGDSGSGNDDADGALALCIVLDQFPRNIFRGSAKAFACDDKALSIAKNAIDRGLDKLLPPIKRRFLYLPFEHSEEIGMQEQSVALFAAMKDDDPLGYDYALRHIEVIERFGRFPHRNAALGRINTAEEEIYLGQEGAGF